MQQIVLKGKVMGKDEIKLRELALIRDSYDLEADYIVVENNWKKPGIWWCLLLTVIPGGILLFNIRRFFMKKETEEDVLAKYGGNEDSMTSKNMN